MYQFLGAHICELANVFPNISNMVVQHIFVSWPIDRLY